MRTSSLFFYLGIVALTGTSTGRTSAQSYDNVTRLSGVQAKAVAVVADRTFSGRVPSFSELANNGAIVGASNAEVAVQMRRITAGASLATYYAVDPVHKRIRRMTSFVQSPGAITLSGGFLAAITLAQKEVEKTQFPFNDLQRFDVQISVPYLNLPYVIYVAYIPKDVGSAIATAPSARTVTLGCSPVVSFSVDLRSDAVNKLKPVC